MSCMYINLLLREIPKGDLLVKGKYIYFSHIKAIVPVWLTSVLPQILMNVKMNSRQLCPCDCLNIPGNYRCTCFDGLLSVMGQ